MLKQDYIMRLIHEMVRTVLKLIFHIDTKENEEIVFENSETEEKYRRFQEAIDNGAINEAENRLWEELDLADQQDLLIALLFYEYLNKKDNDFLEQNNFSREEIAEGLRHVTDRYGYGEMADVLLDHDLLLK